jgi:hypothetical protein
MYTSDGRRVKQYEIGGMGTVNLKDARMASGNILFKLDVDGKTYTERMNLAR